MEKILFVGDLRSAINYGAIATTEALLDLVVSHVEEAEIRCIDFRSFRGTTPKEGLSPFNIEKYIENVNRKKSSIKEKLKTTFVYTMYGKYREVILGREDLIDNIPSRLEDYNEFVSRIMTGKTWEFERKNIEWADIIIVNSEGNIVNGTDADGKYRFGGRYVLFFEFLAKKVFHKKCYVVNHTVDPKNRDIIKIIKEVYPSLDGVYVREHMSETLLENWGIRNCRYIPDALWSHDFEKDYLVQPPAVLEGFKYNMPYICLGDSSGIVNGYSKVKWNIVSTYIKLIYELQKLIPQIIFIDGYNGRSKEVNEILKKTGIPSVNLFNCSYHELFYVLSNAEIFVSGRWHASIISLLANTPILLWGADSHKTEALYREIGYPYEFFDVQAIPLNIDRIVEETDKIIHEGHDEIWDRVRILKEKAYENVDMLRDATRE